MFLLMPHPTRFARWLLATVLILTLNVRSSSANPSPQRFDIPAGDAATALRLAAPQAGREIMFPAAIVQGVRVAAVRGEFTVEEAVTRLLAGTDLQLVNDAGSSALAVGRAAAAASPRNPAPLRPTLTAALDQEVITLTPFQVGAGDNTGWAPSETLAGTRFKTKLADLASQIDVFTLDFMEEFGFTSIESASVYSLNIENSTEFVNNVESKGGGEGDLRVRGIGQARRTREFFAANSRSDNYNLERVTLASGPNPMMFGIGAPTGAVDSSLARPIMNRNTRQLKTQFDSFGGIRGELHLNQTLVQNKLAFRGALLADNKKFYPRPSIDRERRGYAALLYKPFKKTQFSVHYENVTGHGRTPSRVPPLDRVRVWDQAGNLGSALGNRPIFSNNLAWQTGRPAGGGLPAIGAKANPDDRVFSTSGDGAISVVGGNNPAGVRAFGSFYSVGVQNIADNGRWPGVVDPVNAGTTRGVSLLNDDYYPRDASYHYFTDFGDRDASIVNLFFNQEILKDLHFEAGYQREENKNFGASYMAGGNGGLNLNVDPNRFLADGVTPNPYAGKLYFDGLAGFDHGWAKSDEWRAALSYELDFKERSKNRFLRMLGRHRIAGIVSAIESKNLNQEYRYNLQPKIENGRMRDPIFSGVNYNIEPDGRRGLGPLGSGYTAASNNRTVNFRSYVGPDLGFVPRVDGYQIGEAWNITDNNRELWTVDPRNAGVGTKGERLITGRNTGGTHTEFGTKLFSYQGYLLEDRVVLTYGRREDSNNTARSAAPAVLWRNPETGQIVSAASAGYQAHIDLYGFDKMDPATEAVGTTTLKGIVVHPFRDWRWKLPLGADLSFMFTESNTFAPNTTSRNPDGSFMASERGEGTDQGFRLGLFEGRFNLRYNEYDVASSPTRLGALFAGIRGAMRNVMKDITRAMVANEADFRAKFPAWPLQGQGEPKFAYPFAAANNGGFETMNFFNYLDPYAVTADTAAKGREITMQWKPTRNLDLRLTWNQQEVVQTKIATQWIQFADEFERIMDKTLFTEGYVPGDTEAIYRNPSGFDMDGDGVIRQYTWNAIPIGAGAGQTVPQNIAAANTPWGRNDDLFAGGWTGQTMKENWISNVRNGNAGVPVLQAYNGRPNEFTRDNRANLNAMYRFSEGTLKGLRVGAGYRWRAPAAIGFGVKRINGVAVPDVDIIQKGKAETAVDLSFGYTGKSNWLGNRRYSLALNVRNAFPQDRYDTRNRDFFNGNSLTTVRLIPRQFIVSYEIDL